MINKDTILSVYTDKQTLLEYLTKIETALDKAVLTSSQLVYEGGNNYHFKFVFEDGSSIETPSITLVQPISKVDFLANGNSVHFVFTLMDGETIATQTINLLKPVTAAAVRDGILYLTLSDGTEVNAGSVTASFGATTFNGEVIVNGNLQVNGNHTEVGNAKITGNVEIFGNVISESYGRKVKISCYESELLAAELIKFPDGSDYFAYEVGKTLHIHARIKITAKSNLQKDNQYGIAYLSYLDDDSRISTKASYKGTVLEALTIGGLEWDGSNQYLPNYFIQKNGDINFYIASDILAGNSVYFDLNQVINL